MNAQHTPTPWKYNGGQITAQGGMAILVATVAAGDIGDAHPEERIPNAAFIVRAVNAHDDLVAALLKSRTNFLRTDFASEKDRQDYAIGIINAALAKAGAA